MTAITISREIGSQGDWIAGNVAKKLGYHLVTKQTLERIFLQYGFVDFNETYDMHGFWARFDPHHGDMVSMLNRVFEALAAYGNVVLVGRGGFAALKDFADVLNICIQAPVLMRIQQVMSEKQLTEIPAAEEFVREQDRIRHDFLQTLHGSRWNATGAFDLVIDMGKIPPQAAVDWIVDTAGRLGEKQFMTQQLCSELDIDPVLTQTIKEILNPEMAF